MRHRSLTLVLAGVLLGLLTIQAPIEATSLRQRNLLELIDLSELILVGRVASISDGFVGGLPFTEVTVTVGESLKGDGRETYTFRQFGLIAPKKMANGLTYVGVTPAGWPRFRQGEEILVFLYKPAEISGLRTTVGLMQGKFTKVDGAFTNGVENHGLFKDITVAQGLLTPGEEQLLSRTRGGVSATEFVSLVRKAVRDRWIETGRMSHAR